MKTGKFIRSIRKSTTSLNQTNYGKMFGVTQQAISNIERDASQASGPLLLTMILDAYRTNKAALLRAIDEVSKNEMV